MLRLPRRTGNEPAEANLGSTTLSVILIVIKIKNMKSGNKDVVLNRTSILARFLLALPTKGLIRPQKISLSKKTALFKNFPLFPPSASPNVAIPQISVLASLLLAHLGKLALVLPLPTKDFVPCQKFCSPKTTPLFKNLPPLPTSPLPNVSGPRTSMLTNILFAHLHLNVGLGRFALVLALSSKDLGPPQTNCSPETNHFLKNLPPLSTSTPPNVAGPWTSMIASFLHAHLLLDAVLRRLAIVFPRPTKDFVPPRKIRSLKTTSFFKNLPPLPTSTPPNLAIPHSTADLSETHWQKENIPAPVPTSSTTNTQ